MEGSPAPRSRRRANKGTRLSMDALLDAALDVLRSEGLDAVSMRRVAAALHTGSASLYVYVSNRDELLEAMLDRVLAGVTLPEPDPERWREQIHALMDDTVSALVRHPGIARVGLADIPTAGAGLRIREAMLAILLAGGNDVQGASWATDALPLFALATALEAGSYAERGTDLEAEGRRVTQAYADLSPDEFPVTVASLAEITNGSRAERFRFAVETFLDGLAARPSD